MLTMCQPSRLDDLLQYQQKTVARMKRQLVPVPIAPHPGGLPPQHPPPMSAEERRKMKNREISTAKNKRRRDKKEAEKRRDDEFKRFISAACDTPLDAETLRVLQEMYKRGDLVDGIANFGVDGEQGFKNGLFYCVLRRETAPAAEYDSSHPRGTVPLFWTKGTGRRQLTLEYFTACARAKFPLVIVGDATDDSVMGTAAMDAVRANVETLGTIGRKSGIFAFGVSLDFADKWKSGSVAESSIEGKTWAIQNHEVRLRHRSRWHVFRSIDTLLV